MVIIFPFMFALLSLPLNALIDKAVQCHHNIRYLFLFTLFSKLIYVYMILKYILFSFYSGFKSDVFFNSSNYSISFNFLLKFLVFFSKK